MNGRPDPQTPPESAEATTPPSDAPREARQVASGIVLKNRYQVDSAIASGGMAQVWRGLDQILNRPVALKILHPHLATDDAFLNRFRREAVASARLAHSSIVAVYDTVSENGIEAIVMELIEGTTLRTVLDTAGQLQPGQVVEIGASIADALDTAHRHGVVHRDIKPANIMVSNERRVVVTDFGIAKANKDSDLTHTGTLLGTAKYLAPEQVAGEPVDPRADLFSLGVVLFEAITGKPPFKGETDAATALLRLQGDAPQCKEIRPDTPDDLNAIIARAMARQPDDRFDRASSMRTALLAANLSNISPMTQPATNLAQAPAPQTQPQQSQPQQVQPRPRQAPSQQVPAQNNRQAPAWQPPGQQQQQPAPRPAYQQSPPPRGTSVMPVDRRQPGSQPVRRQKQTKRPPPTRSKKRSRGRPAPPQPKPKSSHRPMRVVAFGLILGGLFIGGLLLVSAFGGESLADRTPNPGDFIGGGDATIVQAVPLDPFDRGSNDSPPTHTERNNMAPFAFDGDIATEWQSETYKRASFGGLKPGVGLVLFLDRPSEVDEIEISTSSKGWSVEVYVGENIGPNNGDFDINAFGPPVGVLENTEDTQELELNSKSGSEVLLWVTETGTTIDDDRGEVHRFVLNEVAVN